MSLTIEELEQFVTSLVSAPEHWAHLVRHCSDERVYEQIWESEDANAWVICWSEDQDTGFHDHDESGAAIMVIAGHVSEERLRLGAAARERLIGPGETFTVPCEAIHRVLHAGEGPAITIHAYSPPLTRTGRYQIGEDGALERESLPFEAELRA